MIEIHIVADVGGVDAVATFKIENLKWLPMDARHEIKDNKLPRVIHEISIRSEKGQITQANIDFFIRIAP